MINFYLFFHFSQIVDRFDIQIVSPVTKNLIINSEKRFTKNPRLTHVI